MIVSVKGRFGIQLNASLPSHSRRLAWWRRCPLRPEGRSHTGGSQPRSANRAKGSGIQSSHSRCSSGIARTRSGPCAFATMLQRTASKVRTVYRGYVKSDAHVTGPLHATNAVRKECRAAQLTDAQEAMLFNAIEQARERAKERWKGDGDFFRSTLDDAFNTGFEEAMVLRLARNSSS
jgi:hypothetical protein